MAEPVKIKFDYRNPDNVKSEVPGSQKIRQPQTENESGEIHEESTTKHGENSKNNEENTKESTDICEEVETRHNKHVFSGKRNGIHGEPVMLGEKTEDKKPKTKIPVSRFRQTVEKVKARRKLSKEHESHIPVRRSSIPKPVKENKTPTTTTKKEINTTKTLIKNDITEVTITKSILTSESKESTKIVGKESNITTEEDEFDKLFADVVNDPQTDINIVETLLDPKVEDPEKLESKFEEIIHDYEEHKVEPIDVEVVRRAKLPHLKRKSQQDIELSNQAERTSKIIAARDKLRLRHSMNKDDNFEKALDEELKKACISIGANFSENSRSSTKDSGPVVDTKTETKHEIICSPGSKTETLTQSTETLSTSSTKDEDNNESSSVFQTKIIKEITKNENKDIKKDKKHYITEENIMKDSIRIVMPVFESQIHEFSETSESTKTIEIKQTMSYTSTSEDLSISNTISENKSEVNTSVSELNNEHIVSKVEKQPSVSELKKYIQTNNVEHQLLRLEDTTQKNTKKLSETKKSIDTQFQQSTSQDKSDSVDTTQENIKTIGETEKSINTQFEKSTNQDKIGEEENTKTIAATKKFIDTQCDESTRTDKTNALETTQENMKTIVETEKSIDTQFDQSAEQDKTDVEGNTKTIDVIEKSNDTQFEQTTSQDKTKIEEASRTEIPREINIEEVQLRGKVEKLVNKIDSKEIIEMEGNERESINELRKKKSVLAKIAMFEKKPQESKFTTGPKKESKLPKLITKDWQKTEQIHVHTPLIVDEVFKPFNSDATLNNDISTDEPLQDVTTIVKAERLTVETSGEVHYASKNNIEVENKTVEEKTEKLEPQQLSVQTNEDTVHIKPKNKLPKLDARPMELNIYDLPTSVVTDNFEFKYNANKVQTPTRLSMTKEIQLPVKIPGFKPVRTLMKSFEENEQKYSIHRSISKDQTNTFRRKVSENNIFNENKVITAQISKTESYSSETYDAFESTKDYKSLDDVFTNETECERIKLRQEKVLERAQSLAELDLGDAFKGKVNSMILRLKSVDKTEVDKRDMISRKEIPRKRSVSEKIALFEGKLTPAKNEAPTPLRIFKPEKTTEKVFQNTDQKTPQKIDIKKIEAAKTTELKRIEIQREKTATEITQKSVTENEISEGYIKKKIEELKNAKIKYGRVEDMPEIELSNGVVMPILAVGTALLDPRLTYYIVRAAIDLGYRAIDTAYIYGTEKQVGEAIKDKIADGTIKREDLFIISKLWSTYHRTDLVEGACRASLDAMGLEYFDLYLIHNPMSFKEGAGPIPKIATVLQYSEYDYLDAWYGMEKLVAKGLVRGIGVSNFNSVQLQRVLDKGKIKPVINQVECHPYLSQQRLDLFCSERNVTLSCFGVLGSKGTPLELKNGQPAAIDDALIQVMASGLGITPAQLLISYQIENGHGVVVKASSAHHLHDNLLALGVRLTTAQVDALHALNRNKRMFTFRGMGDTHKNYPFHAAF